jgi:hypothetical protein
LCTSFRCLQPVAYRDKSCPVMLCVFVRRFRGVNSSFRLMLMSETDKSVACAWQCSHVEEVDTELVCLLWWRDSSQSPAPMKKIRWQGYLHETGRRSGHTESKWDSECLFKKKEQKKVSRTKLTVLVSPIKAFRFAKTLAKILTFGAPGRFQQWLVCQVCPWRFEQAREMLDWVTARDLSLEESAEIFNVVNAVCWLLCRSGITSSLRKDEKLTVNAIQDCCRFHEPRSVLIRFDCRWHHCTCHYNGDLSKSKLEQMYGAYAVSRDDGHA